MWKIKHKMVVEMDHHKKYYSSHKPSNLEDIVYLLLFHFVSWINRTTPSEKARSGWQFMYCLMLQVLEWLLILLGPIRNCKMRCMLLLLWFQFVFNCTCSIPYSSFLPFNWREKVEMRQIPINRMGMIKLCKLWWPSGTSRFLTTCCFLWYSLSPKTYSNISKVAFILLICLK